MAGLVSAWFAKIGQETAAPVAVADAEEAGRRLPQSDVKVDAEMMSGKTKKQQQQQAGAVVIQERMRRRNSGILCNSEATVCLLMDRFAPA